MVFQALSVSDRGHLLNDAFSLAEATLLSYDIALTLTNYLKNETEYVPWSVASTNLLNLKNRLSPAPNEKFQVSFSDDQNYSATQNISVFSFIFCRNSVRLWLVMCTKPLAGKLIRKLAPTSIKII